MLSNNTCVGHTQRGGWVWQPSLCDNVFRHSFDHHIRHMQNAVHHVFRHTNSARQASPSFEYDAYILWISFAMFSMWKILCTAWADIHKLRCCFCWWVSFVFFLLLRPIERRSTTFGISVLSVNAASVLRTFVPNLCTDSVKQETERWQENSLCEQHALTI